MLYMRYVNRDNLDMASAAVSELSLFFYVTIFLTESRKFPASIANIRLTKKIPQGKCRKFRKSSAG